MKARDVMTEGPVSVRSSTPLRECVAVLQSLDVRHLPVIDRHGQLVGVLSDRDLRKLDLHASRLEAPVSQVVSTGVFSVGPDADVIDVVDLMIDQQIGAVPVVDEDGALIGIVSYVDLLRELAPLAATA
jgi:acetoin utilization protein AcuB